MNEVQRQNADGSWSPATPLPAPWLLRVQRGELNGRGQKLLALPVLATLWVVHLVADLRRSGRGSNPRGR